MADRLGVVVAGHQQQWDAAVKFSPRLLTLQPVLDAQNDFRATLRSIADANLTANRNFVAERKKTLGIDAESQAVTSAARHHRGADVRKVAFLTQGEPDATVTSVPRPAGVQESSDALGRLPPWTMTSSGT